MFLFIGTTLGVTPPFGCFRHLEGHGDTPPFRRFQYLEGHGDTPPSRSFHHLEGYGPTFWAPLRRLMVRPCPRALGHRRPLFLPEEEEGEDEGDGDGGQPAHAQLI